MKSSKLRSLASNAAWPSVPPLEAGTPLLGVLPLARQLEALL